MVGWGSHQTDNKSLKFAGQLILQIIDQILSEKVLVIYRLSTCIAGSFIKSKWIQKSQIDREVMVSGVQPCQSCFCTLRWFPAFVRCFLPWSGPVWPPYHFLWRTKQHCSATGTEGHHRSPIDKTWSELLTDAFHSIVQGLSVRTGVAVRSIAYCASEHLWEMIF